MISIHAVKKHFGADEKIENIKGNLRLLHNHSTYISPDLQGTREEILEVALAILSPYEYGRIELAGGDYRKARSHFNQIENDSPYYWDTQFQFGRIEKVETPNNNYLLSLAYWEGIPKSEEAYWDAQYAIGNLGEDNHHHYHNIPKGHKRYYDAISRLGCIELIEAGKQEIVTKERVEKAARYFHMLPDTYSSSKIFQELCRDIIRRLNKNTLH